MSQNTDLRVRRTQKMLQQAFMDLVLEEGFDALTVQMLADRAMINRATFYRHYQDKYDLAEKVYTTLTAEYAQTIQEVQIDNQVVAWQLLFEHLGRYGDFYLALLSEMPQFRERVQTSIEQQTHAELLRMEVDPDKTTLPLPIILRYLATAQMGIVQWWLETGQSIPVETMAQYLMLLHTQGGVALLNMPEPTLSSL